MRDPDQLERFVDAAAREARGVARPGDVRLLESDRDLWAAALDVIVDRVDRQLTSRRETQAAAVEAGDAERARTLGQGIADWLPKARRFQAGCRERRKLVDLERADDLYVQLRTAAGELYPQLLEGAVTDEVTDRLRVLLDQLDDVDPFAVAS